MEYNVRLFQKIESREMFIPKKMKSRQQWMSLYDAIFEHWNNESELQKAIIAILDYHQKWNFGKYQNHNPECHSNFTAVNPIEIHSLEFVRNKLGLPTPKVEHVLLQYPFYPVPQCAYTVTLDSMLKEDKLFRRIYDVYTCPEVGESSSDNETNVEN